MGISLKPSTASSGGLFQDADVTITKCRACVYDYNGKVSPPVLAVHMTLLAEDGTSTRDEIYSVGALSRYAPAETSGGPALENVGDEGAFITTPEGSTATGLSKSSNFMFFVREAAQAGFPAEEKLTDDVSVFEGMVFHAVRKQQEKREGLATPAASDDKGPKTTLVPSKIIKLPWEGKSKAATAAAGAKSGGADVNAVAIKAIQDVLSKAGPEGVTPGDAKKVAFPVLVKNQSVAVRNEAVKLITDTAWLEANQGADTFIFMDGKITSAV